MDVSYALLADGATQRPDGKLDLYGAGIEQLNVLELPVRHGHLTVVARIRLAFEEAAAAHQLQVDLVDPDGAATIPTLSFPVQMPPEELDRVPPEESHVGFNGVFNLEGLVFRVPGPHVIVLKWNGRVIQQLVLTVVKAGPAQAAA